MLITQYRIVKCPGDMFFRVEYTDRIIDWFGWQWDTIAIADTLEEARRKKLELEEYDPTHNSYIVK
jgi:hypothetical protein